MYSWLVTFAIIGCGFLLTLGSAQNSPNVCQSRNETQQHRVCNEDNTFCMDMTYIVKMIQCPDTSNCFNSSKNETHQVCIPATSHCFDMNALTEITTCKNVSYVQTQVQTSTPSNMFSTNTEVFSPTRHLSSMIQSSINICQSRNETQQHRVCNEDNTFCMDMTYIVKMIQCPDTSNCFNSSKNETHQVCIPATLHCFDMNALTEITTCKNVSYVQTQVQTSTPSNLFTTSTEVFSPTRHLSSMIQSLINICQSHNETQQHRVCNEDNTFCMDMTYIVKTIQCPDTLNCFNSSKNETHQVCIPATSHCFDMNALTEITTCKNVSYFQTQVQTSTPSNLFTTNTEVFSPTRHLSSMIQSSINICQSRNETQQHRVCNEDNTFCMDMTYIVKMIQCPDTSNCFNSSKNETHQVCIPATSHCFDMNALTEMTTCKNVSYVQTQVQTSTSSTEVLSPASNNISTIQLQVQTSTISSFLAQSTTIPSISPSSLMPLSSQDVLLSKITANSIANSSSLHVTTKLVTSINMNITSTASVSSSSSLSGIWNASSLLSINGNVSSSNGTQPITPSSISSPSITTMISHSKTVGDQSNITTSLSSTIPEMTQSTMTSSGQFTNNTIGIHPSSSSLYISSNPFINSSSSIFVSSNSFTNFSSSLYASSNPFISSSQTYNTTQTLVTNSNSINSSKQTNISVITSTVSNFSQDFSTSAPLSSAKKTSTISLKSSTVADTNFSRAISNSTVESVKTTSMTQTFAESTSNQLTMSVLPPSISMVFSDTSKVIQILPTQTKAVAKTTVPPSSFYSSVNVICSSFVTVIVEQCSVAVTSILSGVSDYVSEETFVTNSTGFLLLTSQNSLIDSRISTELPITTTKLIRPSSTQTLLPNISGTISSTIEMKTTENNSTLTLSKLVISITVSSILPSNSRTVNRSSGSIIVSASSSPLTSNLTINSPFSTNLSSEIAFTSNLIEPTSVKTPSTNVSQTNFANFSSVRIEKSENSSVLTSTISMLNATKSNGFQQSTLTEIQQTDALVTPSPATSMQLSTKVDSSILSSINILSSNISSIISVNTLSEVLRLSSSNSSFSIINATSILTNLTSAQSVTSSVSSSMVSPGGGKRRKRRNVNGQSSVANGSATVMDMPSSILMDFSSINTFISDSSIRNLSFSTEMISPSTVSTLLNSTDAKTLAVNATSNVLSNSQLQQTFATSALISLQPPMSNNFSDGLTSPLSTLMKSSNSLAYSVQNNSQIASSTMINSKSKQTTSPLQESLGICKRTLTTSFCYSVTAAMNMTTSSILVSTNSQTAVTGISINYTSTNQLTTQTIVTHQNSSTFAPTNQTRQTTKITYATMTVTSIDTHQNTSTFASTNILSTNIVPTTTTTASKHFVTSEITSLSTSVSVDPSSIAITSGASIRSSTSTILMSSAVGTTSVTPTVTPAAKNQTLLQIDLIITDLSINVNSVAFINETEQKLVDTYAAAILIQKIQKRRKRRSTNGPYEVQINSVSRNGSDVKIRFSVKENGKDVPPEQASETFNLYSRSGLQKRLGYPISNPVSEVNPIISYKLSDLMAVLLEGSNTTNSISVPSNQNLFKTNMALFYKQRLQPDAQDVAVELVEESIKDEIGGFSYVQFSLSVSNVSQDATSLATLFSQQTLVLLNAALNPLKAVHMPYPAHIVAPTNRDHFVRMKINAAIGISTPDKASLAPKIADIYLTGKHLTTKRKRRNVGSIETVITTLIGSRQLEIIFTITDRGEAILASDIASTMNKVSIATMQQILGAEVTLAPEPLVYVTTATDDNLKYWIIGVVGGAVILMSLIMIIICWRWKKGGPPAEKILSASDQVDAAAPGEEQKEGAMSPYGMQEAEDSQIVKNDGMTKPLFAGNNAKNLTNDYLHSSQRPKIQRSSLKKSQNFGRQNPGYDPSKLNEIKSEEESDEYEEEEEEEEDESEEDEDVYVNRSRRSSAQIARTPPQKPPRRRLDYTPPRGQTPPSVPKRREYENGGRRPLEMTGNTLQSDTQNYSYTADHVPTFSYMNDSKENRSNPPVRFRTDIESIDAYTRPSGPLPVLDLQQTSLISSAQTPVNPEDNHKTEVERMRNKQRQRDQLFSASSRDPMTSSLRHNDQMNSSWRREQDKINAILDPMATDLQQRKGRLRRKMQRRQNKISMAPMDQSYDDGRGSENIELKSFKSTASPGLNRSTDRLYDDAVSEGADSEISMREARRRIHSLLDDTFSTLKKYQTQIGKNDVEEKTTPPKRPTSREGGQRYAGMTPALKEPPPAHGRASTTPPGSNKKRAVPNPYTMPQYPQYPAYADPMVTWDPMERQRYINQRLGYPMYAPAVNSLSMPYGANPGQNVYITPVQQRPDGMGGMMWSPYATADNYPQQAMDMGMKQGGQVPGASPLTRLADPYSATPPHNTTIDLSDIGSLKKDSSSQPLIRAIKEELLKLSHSTKGKTRVQEFHSNVPS